MTWQTSTFRFVWLLLVLSGLLVSAGACSSGTYEGDVVVTVFEDLNSNRELDRGEPPIPSVPVVFSAGCSSTREFTDNQGQATARCPSSSGSLPGPDALVQVPCGYHATTATSFPVAQEVHFGFVPVTPRPGTASVHFHLWEDRDGDFRQGADEPALAFVEFDSLPGRGSGNLKTDAEGRVTQNLGNTCSTLQVYVPKGWATTVITPSTTSGVDYVGGPYAMVPYDVGITQVEWGLRKP